MNEEIEKLMNKYSLNEELSQEQLSSLRQDLIEKVKTDKLFFLRWCQAFQVHNYNITNIQKLGWDWDDKETEEEQIEFTKIIGIALDELSAADLEELNAK